MLEYKADNESDYFRRNINVYDDFPLKRTQLSDEHQQDNTDEYSPDEFRAILDDFEVFYVQEQYENLDNLIVKLVSFPNIISDAKYFRLLSEYEVIPRLLNMLFITPADAEEEMIEENDQRYIITIISALSILIEYSSLICQELLEEDFVHLIINNYEYYNEDAKDVALVCLHYMYWHRNLPLLVQMDNILDVAKLANSQLVIDEGEITPAIHESAAKVILSCSCALYRLKDYMESIEDCYERFRKIFGILYSSVCNIFDNRLIFLYEPAIHSTIFLVLRFPDIVNSSKKISEIAINGFNRPEKGIIYLSLNLLLSIYNTAFEQTISDLETNGISFVTLHSFLNVEQTNIVIASLKLVNCMCQKPGYIKKLYMLNIFEPISEYQDYSTFEVKHWQCVVISTAINNAESEELEEFYHGGFFNIIIEFIGIDSAGYTEAITEILKALCRGLDVFPDFKDMLIKNNYIDELSEYQPMNEEQEICLNILLGDNFVE